MLFQPGARFQGLPDEGFGVFEVRNDNERRREIHAVIHPALELLAAFEPSDRPMVVIR